VLPEHVVELAKAPNYAVFSTTLPSGHPQTHVMWVDSDGEHLLINTVVSRQKYRNVQANPKVSVTIINGTDFFDWVEVRGLVVGELTGQQAWDHINELAHTYFDAPFGGPRLERVILQIRPERIVEHQPG
jgi:PPOX class probable F420-dependent enzyme